MHYCDCSITVGPVDVAVVTLTYFVRPRPHCFLQPPLKSFQDLISVSSCFGLADAVGPWGTLNLPRYDFSSTIFGEKQLSLETLEKEHTLWEVRTKVF
jgi:hypothetical protein